MLKFEITENFVIHETILGWYAESKKTVEYTKDLKLIRVNNDPWTKTSKVQRVWFEAHYRKHFDALEESCTDPKGGIDGK
jgi:hypothetical protein